MLYPLERVLTNEDLDWELNPEVEKILTFLHSQHGPGPPFCERLEWCNVPKLKPSIKEPPSNFKYVFINPPSSLPVMIAASLHEIEEKKLLRFCKDKRETFGWNIKDMKGLDHTLCTKEINPKEEFLSKGNLFPTWWKLWKERMLSPLSRWRHTIRHFNRVHMNFLQQLYDHFFQGPPSFEGSFSFSFFFLFISFPCISFCFIIFSFFPFCCISTPSLVYFNLVCNIYPVTWRRFIYFFLF